MIQADSIIKLLTLRYNPSKKPFMRPATPADFEPRVLDNIELSVLELIRKDLVQKEHISKYRHLSLSLSGGVDSRLTLAMMRTFLPDVRVNCISVGFGDNDDELETAREVARVYDCDFLSLVLDDFLTDLPKLISIVEEPRWNLYHYYAFEQGKKFCDVFYTGDGGDELFGGYTFRYHKFLSLLSEDSDWKEKAKLYLSCHERDWVPDQHRIFGPELKFSWERIYDMFQPYFDNALDPIDQVFLADFNGKLLYDWLPGNVRFARFLNLKIESLFLTRDMIRFATHIPWRRKYDQQANIGKLPLYSILSKQKGHESINVVKKGFSVDPVSLWSSQGREIATNYVNAESEVVRRGLISEKWIKETHKKLNKDGEELDPRYINKMLTILALEIWHRIFVSGSMNSKQKL
jgi:asparagine synthase (glutamine-hydrolysing)